MRVNGSSVSVSVFSFDVFFKRHVFSTRKQMLHTRALYGYVRDAACPGRRWSRPVKGG